MTQVIFILLVKNIENQFISLTTEANRYVNDKNSIKVNLNEDYELSFVLTIEPIKIQIDQIVLLFFLKFFNFNLKKMNEKQEVASQIKEIIPIENDKMNSSKLVWIRRALIKEFFISFDYNSSKMDFGKLIGDKDLLEAINLFNINSFKIKFKTFDSKTEVNQLMTINEFLKIIIQYWQNDFVSNQALRSAINSFGILRPFKKIFDGFVGIFKIPYQKGIKDGISEGLRNFILNCSSQSLFLGENVK